MVKNAPDAPTGPVHPFTLRAKFDTVDHSRATNRETLVPVETAAASTARCTEGAVSRKANEPITQRRRDGN